jgi:putative transposase
MIPLYENSVLGLILEDQSTVVERVLWLDPSSDTIVMIALEDDALPVPKSYKDTVDTLESGRAFRRPDPCAKYADPENEMLEKHSGRRDRAWEVIKDLVKKEPAIYQKETRGRLIREAAAAHNVPRKEVYRFLKRYWVGGKVKNALLPFYDNCGGPGNDRIIPAFEEKKRPKRGRPCKITMIAPDNIGINVDQNILTIFDCSIRLYYDTEQKHPLKHAYNEMLDNHFNVGTTRKNGVVTPIHAHPSQQPTYDQFAYWYQKRQDLKNSIIKREGVRKYNLQSRPVLGSSTQMAFGPGSIYQIDATIGDIFLVSRLNRSWIIGRPVIYFVMDVFTRMAVGLYIGLEGPSWAGAMMAIANATTDKVSYCAEYGIQIRSDQWPTHFLPSAILGDRGELIGYNADNLPDSLGITVANCPPYRADLKGIVEKSFHRAKQKTIDWLPGAIQGPIERGDKDYRLNAVLDLHQFTKIIILTLLEYNQHHWMDWYDKDRDLIRDDVKPIPLNLWEWGIKHRVGQLRERSPEVIKLGLMPKGEATVTERGIRFEGAFYTTERAMVEQWYIKARRNGTWKVPVCFEPRTNDIYLRVGGNSLIEPCTLIERDKRFEGMRLEEVQQFVARENLVATLHEGAERQSSADLRAQTKQVVSEAKEEFAKAGTETLTSKNQRTKGVKQNRAAEKRLNREAEAFDLTGQPKEVIYAPTAPHDDRDPEDTPDSDPVITGVQIRNKFLQMMKKNSQRGQND